MNETSVFLFSRTCNDPLTTAILVPFSFGLEADTIHAAFPINLIGQRLFSSMTTMFPLSFRVGSCHFYVTEKVKEVWQLGRNGPSQRSSQNPDLEKIEFVYQSTLLLNRNNDPPCL